VKKFAVPIFLLSKLAGDEKSPKLTIFMYSRSKRPVGLVAVRACERSGKRSGATRKSGGAERSGERVLHKNDGAERSGARSGGSRSGNGAGSGGCRITLERGAALLPVPLRSHALVAVAFAAVCNIIM